MKWLDRIPWSVAIILAIILGLAPFSPEPHLWQKFKMLAANTLHRPIDIFDLVWHSSGPILLALKIGRWGRTGAHRK